MPRVLDKSGAVPVMVNALRAFHYQSQQDQNEQQHNIEDYVVDHLTSPHTRVIKDHSTDHIRDTVHERYERSLNFTQNTHNLTFTTKAKNKKYDSDKHILATFYRFAQVRQCNVGDKSHHKRAQ